MNMTLSVIICTYNRGRYLPMILDSLRFQALSSELFEIIMVNNKSTDNTEEIISNYIKEFPDIPLKYFMESSQGISYARNRGIQESRGDIIVFLDDDETIDPDFLEGVLDFFTNHPDAGITAGPVIPVYEDVKPAWLTPFISRAITGEYNKGDHIKLLKGKDYPGTGHACFRKELFYKYGIFNPDLGRKGNSVLGAEDKDFFLRLIKGGEKCYYLPIAKIYHHLPAEKMSVDFFVKIAYGIGKSERIRTYSSHKKAYLYRFCVEIFKWFASVALWIAYFVTGRLKKGNKIILFRYYITKGLIGC
ncbi:MAG: glycosyltransferase [Tannerellaceae bacterium]|nr:glycosyltransferase [Tannerellaceae bacterium]